jgi:hypothetical protein
MGFQRAIQGISVFRHTYAHSASFPFLATGGKLPVALSVKIARLFCALSKRATCAPFPMAHCVRTNRPHAEIFSDGGFFSKASVAPLFIARQAIACNR